MSLLDEIVANIESIVCKDELKKYLFRNVCFVNDEDMYVIETALLVLRQEKGLIK